MRNSSELADVRRGLPLLVDAALCGDDATVRGAVLGWTPQQLVAVSRTLNGRSGTVLRVRAAAGGTSATWLAALSRDGRLREAMIDALAADRSPVADRILAVLMNDHVAEIRSRAWWAASGRVTERAAAVALPVLIAHLDRQHGAQVLARYSALVEERTGIPAWRLAWLADDRTSLRWGVAAWLDTAPPVASLVAALDTLPEQGAAALVLDRLERTITADDADLLRGAHRPALRALWLLRSSEVTADDVLAGLRHRSGTVRGAARSRAADVGVDAPHVYLQAWQSEGSPQALRGALECGAVVPREELLPLLASEEPGAATVAVVGLTHAGVVREDVPRLVGLLGSARAASPAARALRRCTAWRYDDLRPLWNETPAQGRPRLAGVLASRRGWDRLRVALLASGDPDPETSGAGRSLLEAWAQSASVLWNAPDEAQLADIVDLLPRADLTVDQRRDIEFRTGLPLTPYPESSANAPWGRTDAAVLLALGRTGRMFTPAMSIPAVMRSAAFLLGEKLSWFDVDAAGCRLSRLGLVVPPQANDFELTQGGRSLLRGLRLGDPGSLDEALARLESLGQPR